MPKYYGTVTFTLSGWFDPDGFEEIQDDPMRYASNCTIETEIVDMDIEEDDADGEDYDD